MQGRNRDAAVGNRLVDTVGEGEGGTTWEIRIDPYILPCVRQTARRKLLYSTRSSGWCSVLTGGVDWGEGRKT